MIQIRSMRGVFVYSLVIGCVAVIVALGLLRLLNGPETPRYFYMLAIKIASFVGPVLGAVGGLRNLHIWRLSEELTRLVNRDRLTDVATRDFFFARLTELPDAYGVSLMIDIDHFKQVNDTHGHLAGDDVIHAVAQVMRAQIRDVDIVCRFGGEEFVVFLHNATAEEGWAIAERIRLRTQELTTRTLSGDVKVIVSVGGSMKERIEHVDAAIKRADECLYRAKTTGRNKTVVDWPRHEDARTLRAS